MPSADLKAPEHTTTYSRGTFPEDEPFDMAKWKRGIQIKILEIAEDDVPTVAIEKVFIRNNNGVLRDEIVAQRLGMIPIKADPARFNFPSQTTKKADENTPLPEDEVIKFKLQVKCGRKPEGGSLEDAPNAKVFSSQLQWVPFGNQAETFACDPPVPVHGDILIARLRPGQEMDMEMHCHKGNNRGERGHAKWSPVATAWYRLLPRIDIVKPLEGELADRLVSKCPMRCYDIEEAPARVRRAVVSDRVRDCTLCRECLREPELASAVRLSRKKDHFIFSVESTGILPPAELFKQAVQLLHDKAKELLEEVEQLEGKALVAAQSEMLQDEEAEDAMDAD